MISPRCQHENPPEARFCNACGAAVEATCPACGWVNPPGSRFCNECGLSLAGRARRVSAGRFASLRSYTPAHLAEKILTSRNALEGERKQVTVLFADLKGSMELLADRDPEEARQLLDPVIARMMAAVHRYEGTVNQVMGDGIMALFGAPIAHEDHAVRACYAALRMQESVKAYAADVQRTQGVPLHIRVGLNAGEVVVRSIASDLRMDYTAVGRTTHLAARMEQLAMPGSILITPGVLELAEGYVQVKPLGPVAIKGLPRPVEVYEVTGAGPVRTRLQAAAARGLTRFVGRDSELDQLYRALQLAGAGHGQVVAIVGEPGVGKSRLVYEFTRSHRTRDWLLLESRSFAHSQATPYLPVRDLLKAYFQIEARDDGRQIREKITGRLLTRDRALEPILPACLALLDVPVEDPQWQALDPPQRRQRTLEAVKRLLLRESQVQPLLLVCEDLHWIDSESQAFLESLIDSLPTARLLLLLNYRPEYQHGWSGETSYAQLRLDPLSRSGAEELLQALLGDDIRLAPLKQLLIERTAGNPFFLEESVRALFDQGVLVPQAAEPTQRSPRLAKPLTEFRLPATVQAVLAARIDRLPTEEKRLLQTAAVIGAEVPFALLRAVADEPEAALHRGLARLRAAEFLYETSLFPELEYSFTHALTHEVAYGGLLQERRRTLHARIVEAIEHLYPEHLAEQVDRLAHHAFQGERWDKAVAYLRQAGAKAMARSAHREASIYLTLALVALQHLPAQRDTLEQAIDLRFDLRTSLFHLGEFAQIFEHLREAEALAEALGDDRRLAQASDLLCANFNILGEHERAIQRGQRALATAAAHGVARLQGAMNFHLGAAYTLSGRVAEALPLLEQAAEQAAAMSVMDFQALRVASLGEAHLAAGRLDEAMALAGRARDFAREHQERGWEAYALRLLGAIAARRAPPDGEQAEAAYRQACALAGELGMRPLLAHCHFGLGILYGETGQRDQACVELAAAVELYRAMEMTLWLPQAEAALAHEEGEQCHP